MEPVVLGAPNIFPKGIPAAAAERLVACGTGVGAFWPGFKGLAEAFRCSTTIAVACFGDGPRTLSVLEREMERRRDRERPSSASVSLEAPLVDTAGDEIIGTGVVDCFSSLMGFPCDMTLEAGLVLKLGFKW